MRRLAPRRARTRLYFFKMTLQEALALHQSGQLDTAEQAYRIHLQSQPGDADALHLLGVLQQQRDDTAAAIDLIRQAIAASPERAQFHVSLGGALLRSGDTDGARASFARALDLDPNS